jgi:hypothetical protein
MRTKKLIQRNVLVDDSAHGLRETGFKTLGGDPHLKAATPATVPPIRWAGMPAKRKSLVRSHATMPLMAGVCIRHPLLLLHVRHFPL